MTFAPWKLLRISAAIATSGVAFAKAHWLFKLG